MGDNWDDYNMPTLKSEDNGNNGSFHDSESGGHAANERRRNRRRDDSKKHASRSKDHSSSDRKKYQKHLNIETETIGLIIGRAGSNINAVQDKFNVKVQIDKIIKVVSISGYNKDEVKSALKHLEEQIEKFEGRQQDGNNNAPPKNWRNGTENKQNGQSNNDDFYNPPEMPRSAASNQMAPIDWDAVKKQAAAETVRRWAHLPPLKKNFYKEAAEVANLSAEEVQRIRTENNNTTASRVFENEKNGDNDVIPNPTWKFEQCFAEYPDILEELRKQNFEKPSPIQSQAWPVLLKGEDLIGIAQTGTGKTLAFLLPAMIHTEYQTTPRAERGGPTVLVLAPTRELALQIEKEVNKYSFRNMKAACLYGGGSRKEQIELMQKGVEIIICTPGRLNDLIQANVVNITTVSFLILDEADRMLDMGFEPQIRKVLLDIRPDRQTVMTSATWPPGVRRLAQSYMKNPIQVCVGTLDLAATHTVQQVIEMVTEDDKFFTIRNFIKNMKPDDKIIVFCGRKTRADDLSSELSLEGFLTQCIHGARDQSDREQAIADISSGEVRILIATDVASRGLDIEDITHVINFDFPRNIEEYVHRVGRTGRAGRTGKSISYFTREDWAMAQELIDILEEAEQSVPDELHNMAGRYKAMKERRANERAQCGNNYRDREGGDRNRRGGGRF